MYFMRIKEKMRNAIVSFCQMQPGVWDVIPRSEVETLVDSAFEPLSKFKGVKLDDTTVCGFVLDVNNKNMDKFLHNINHNAGICCFGVFIGGYRIDEYLDINTGNRITSRYELFYDKRYDSIRLYYRVDVSDDNFTAVYCTEDYSFKEFSLYEFIRSITVQITDILERNSPVNKRVYNRKKKEEV